MALEGKTAIITGAGRGIGRGIAEAFAREGADVALFARTPEELAETAKIVRGYGRRALEIVCDVSNRQNVCEATARVLVEWSQVDILVNNAGYACFKPFMELSAEEWTRTLEVNLTGAFHCIQAVLPSMMARRSGRIINISSVAGLKPIVNQSAYCASKHGMMGLTRTLALELREHGIGVHAVCPGGVATRLSHEAMPERDKTGWLTAEDVAHAALYLATLSPLAATDEIVVRRFGSTPIGG